MMSIPHYRRNFLAIVGDFIGFSLAMTFVSSTTVLPALAGHLTESEVAIGLVSTMSTGAWLIPQLLFANLLTSKRRKKPYIMLGGVIGRPLHLVYGVALALGLYLYPSWALLLLFVVQMVFFVADSLASVAWFDVTGKAIPDERRGRLFGTGQLISGILAIGAGVLIAALLGDQGPAFPYNYSVILALASVFLLFSLGSLALVIEPDEPVEEVRPAWRDYFPRLRDTLRHDRAFARLVLVRLLAGFDALALGFYVLFATRELGLPPATIGLFTAAQTVGRILTSVVMGALAERAGSHRVIQVATAIGLTAPLMGLAMVITNAQAGTATAVVYSWVFVTMGITISSSMLGYFNYALELAPAGQRPTYIGLFNTISGVLVVLPTVGGWLLQVSSYGVLFGLTAAVMITAHVLSLTLPSVRRRTSQLQPEPVA
jgi:MFS family permease